MLIPAIALYQPYASWVADGTKPIETRLYRIRQFQLPVDILICATHQHNFDYPDLPYGVALCVVTVTDIHPMRLEDADLACIPYDPKRFSWVLANRRVIAEPFPTSCRQGLQSMEVPDDALVYL